MPLLRLASLIFASLLLAALSALSPAPAERQFSVPNQSHDATSAITFVAVDLTHPNHAMAPPDFSSLRQRGRLLGRVAGQSIPETGQ